MGWEYIATYLIVGTICTVLLLLEDPDFFD